MAFYRRCHICQHKDGCKIKAAIGAAIKGLRITSILHTCDQFQGPFSPGDPVKYTITEQDEWDEREVVYPGHFIEHIGPRALIYIKPGAEDVSGWGDEATFQPHGTGEGYCKVSYQRISPNPDGQKIEICGACGVPEVSCYDFVVATECLLKRKATQGENDA